MSSPLFLAFDVEADGPCPGLYSMLSLGVVSCEDPQVHFYGEFQPISEKFIERAMGVGRFTREQAMGFEPAGVVTQRLAQWAKTLNSRSLVLVSDNPAFDWQFVNYYLHAFTGGNPFGHSARRLGDVTAGFHRDLSRTKDWKRDRTTKHSHHALDDARGVAEGWAALQQRLRPRT